MSVPLLRWAQRPRAAKCAGCGREPLCGFLSDDGETFYGACCYSDGPDQDWMRTTRDRVPRPRLRTPEERARILRCH